MAQTRALCNVTGRMHYQSEQLSTAQAVAEAQRLALAPLVFHAAMTLRDLGILKLLNKRADAGASESEIAAAANLSEYATAVLLDAALSARLILRKDPPAGSSEKFYRIANLGRVFERDKMTRINADFARDVCDPGARKLRASLETATPAGLHAVFGSQWSTIYPALSSLPEPAKSSWFAYDHFYSDGAFSPALERIFNRAEKPRLLYDVGGNTGRFALRATAHDTDVHVTVLDLPEQIALLRENLKSTAGDAAAGNTRISGHPVNILDETAVLPRDADAWWCSQFLDCFSEPQVLSILRRIRAAMKPTARLFILEPLCDRQPFEPAAAILNFSSLYFTCMANGNSRFFREQTLLNLIAGADLRLVNITHDLGVGGHSLLEMSISS